MEYAIKLSVQDTIAACENYLRHRRHRANLKRIKMINELTTPTVVKRFFFFESVKQATCGSVRDAIRYMKREQTIFDTTLWDDCNRYGEKWEDLARDLLTILKIGTITSDVELGDDMAFLAAFVHKDF